MAVLWAMTLAWAALIFFLSTEAYASSFTAWLLHQILRALNVTVSAETFALLHHAIRKLAHATEYAIFAAFLYHCLEPTHRTRWRGRSALWTILVVAAYALADEFHQIFVPGRTASPLDSLLDTFGAALGLLLLYAAGRSFREPISDSDLVPTDVAGTR